MTVTLSLWSEELLFSSSSGNEQHTLSSLISQLSDKNSDYESSVLFTHVFGMHILKGPWVSSTTLGLYNFLLILMLNTSFRTMEHFVLTNILATSISTYSPVSSSEQLKTPIGLVMNLKSYSFTHGMEYHKLLAKSTAHCPRPLGPKCKSPKTID